MIACPRCSAQEIYKNGHRNGRQCYLCRSCGYQFTNLGYRERPVWEKLLAALLHAVGVSPAEIATLFKTSISSVLRWRVSGRGRAEEREPVRDKPVVLGISKLRPMLDDALLESGGSRPVVLIVDEKHEDRVVGVIIQD
ncbi:MAG: hypothetical protein Q4F72_05505 [Desulfovibrionaceae bacterium]|nr:hypothetical protein [Desulfovibrionaceae bacterium]